MDWRTFVAGIVVGWLIEFAIDWFYWRKRPTQTTPSLAAATATPADMAVRNENRIALQSAKSRIQQLEGELAITRDDHNQKLGNAQTQVKQLQLQLSASQSKAARLEASEAQVNELKGELAGYQECAENLLLAQAEVRRLRGEVQRLRPIEPDDLKRVEGIGPKIEGLLNNAGILTFRHLATTEVGRLQTILSEAGKRYRLADPGSWPRQARLAADEKWDELDYLQSQLKGGRPPEKGGASPL